MVRVEDVVMLCVSMIGIALIFLGVWTMASNKDALGEEEAEDENIVAGEEKNAGLRLPGSRKQALKEARKRARQQAHAMERAREQAKRDREQRRAEEQRKWDESGEMEDVASPDEPSRKEPIVLPEPGHAALSVQEETAFIDYIQSHRVVAIEDLATEFGFTFRATVQHIENLLRAGTITGVRDDRGRFVYLGVRDMQEIASLLSQRGRVSLHELAQECSRIVQVEST